MTYLYLVIAIVCEVVATSALKQADGFTRLWPSLVCIAGYGAAFYLLSILHQDHPRRRCLCDLVGRRDSC